MIIHEPTKKIVLNLGNPDRVTTVIPSARVIELNGIKLVAVPHRLDEVRVLHNMGIDAPSPIAHYYQWPGRFKPFEAQLATASFLTLNPKAFVLNDLGTGKTLSALWAFDYLRSQGLAKRMLVVSPLSTLERAWADEIFGNFPHLSYNVLYGPREKRAALLELEADIYLINHDGMKVILPQLLEREDIDTLVVDEIATFRNQSTDRWKTLKKVSAGKERVWGLTGTPTPNAPTDAWAQCRIICPERVPTYFGKFRDMVMRQQGPFKWEVRKGAETTVAGVMQPSVRFTRDQCVDLPPVMYETREVSMTKDQEHAYKEMVDKLKIEIQQQQVTAVNEAVKLSKLLQIACGVVYDSNGQEVAIPCPPRIDVVKEIIEEAGTKVIVFVPFKSALGYVQQELSKDFTTAVISGDVPKAARDQIFSAFQRAKAPRVLIAQPAAMSHGLTLTAASTIIWYAPVTSNEIYEQANGRITRPGQKHSQLIVNIEGTQVERRMYKRLRDKGKMQGLLLDLVK
jgi:SNF2 family DNA or RNA helicase